MLSGFAAGPSGRLSSGIPSFQCYSQQPPWSATSTKLPLCRRRNRYCTLLQEIKQGSIVVQHLRDCLVQSGDGWQKSVKSDVASSCLQVPEWCQDSRTRPVWRQPESSQPACGCQFHILYILNSGVHLSIQQVFPHALVTVDRVVTQETHRIKPGYG